MDIRDIVAFVGMLTGVAGFTLSLINYRREDPKVHVELSWNDFSCTDDYLDGTKYVVKVSVANAGRRDVYIRDVRIIIPEKYNTEYKSISMGNRVSGVSLEEGSAPVVYERSQSAFEFWLKPKLLEFPEMQKQIIAEVTDSGGRKYYSKPCKTKIKFGTPSL
ncbi:hypothetical protein CTB58_003879 [Vibrio mimicus]